MALKTSMMTGMEMERDEYLHLHIEILRQNGKQVQLKI